jgi:hypothetical protein
MATSLYRDQYLRVDNLTVGGTLVLQGGSIVGVSEFTTGIVNAETNDDTLTVSGGDGADTGSSITLHGGDHATNANDLFIRSGGDTILSWNDNATYWNYNGTDIVGVGDLSSTGRLNIGSDPVDYYANRITNSFDSGGGDSVVGGFILGQDLTAAAGDTTWHTHFAAGTATGGSITTQGAAETITTVSTVQLSEPNIIVGAGDTITNAATLHITSEPTEGINNYGLLVSASVRVGNITTTGNLISNTATGAITVAGGAEGM